ncbi:DUF3265 domain-containing protein [Vibrio parahaemolyticus]|nr:DUF3265 domain-containing protein [Vibrio parahaemolyticus]MUT55292.1 DUF3265 domain-containing protein [Vibrio parahaemolyticus]TOF06471.1 DUF3265 domain-containing protein [Vibrio parahaemolyticus]TPA22840.1 DUF3265 domain-containing protein [Vibrio parahaemolyticus]HCG7949928.1 DUF3265 domain-containing protein [Vibrio parahaemolyticus]
MSIKLLKRDSQRVAFLLCVEFSDLSGMRRLRYCVAHPLAGRYMAEYPTFSRHFTKLDLGSN